VEAVDEVVVPAVEVPVEAQHARAAGGRAADAQGEVGCLGPGVREAHALGAGHHRLDGLGPAHGQRRVLAEVCAHRGGLAHGLEHGRVGVPEQQRAVPHEEVDVLVTVDVPLPAALAVRHVHRDRREEPQVVAGAASEHLRRGPCNLSQSALLFCCRP
jgi:hypothetical protein